VILRLWPQRLSSQPFLKETPMNDRLCASSECQDGGPLIDPVSGAYTLDYLARHLEGEIARSQRHGHSLSVLHCEFGQAGQHDAAVGDAASSGFACRVAGCIRKEDWLIRVGATAFKIVLPETNTGGARCVACKIHERFADLPALRIDVIALEPHRRPADATALAARLQFEKEVIRHGAAGGAESHFTRFLNALTAAGAARATSSPS
jgi:GGDEF domain-containing protein